MMRRTMMMKRMMRKVGNKKWFPCCTCASLGRKRNGGDSLLRVVLRNGSG